MSPHEPAAATERKQRISGVFDRAAVTYDQLGPHYFSYFGRRLVELMQLPAGASVLDVATGRGATLFPAAAEVGVNGRVVGTDFATTMVAETAKELVLRSVTNVEVRQMDAEHLAFPDESFDYLFCGFALFFFPQLDRALAEFHRVLKPHGRIGVTTWGNSFKAQVQWFEETVEAYLPRSPAPQPALNLAGNQDPVFDTPEGMEAILRAAGFTGIQVISEVREFIYASKEDFWATLWSHGTRKALETIEQTAGPEGLQRFKAEVFAKADAVMQADGIHQQFPVLYTLAAKPEPMSEAKVLR